jgi:predicted metal-dependent hydrolase
LIWSKISVTTETHQITVNRIRVDIVRKDIKNLHLGVYPPDGRVRVAAPLAVSDDAVRLAVVGKLGWIKRQQAKFAAQPRQSRREMVSGESHYFLGQRYRLRIIEHHGAGKVVLRNKATLELHVKPETTCRTTRTDFTTVVSRAIETIDSAAAGKVAAGIGC